jgi:hypothetical protein
MDADALPWKKDICVSLHPLLETSLNTNQMQASDLSGAFFMDEIADLRTKLGYLNSHQSREMP